VTGSRWFRAKKEPAAQPETAQADASGREVAADQGATVVRMLEGMAREEPDISGDDLESLQESLAVARRHVQAIESLGASAIPDLREALRHADPKVRQKSCWALQILGSTSDLTDETVLAIAGLMSDEDGEVREQALSSLGALAPRTDLTPALASLQAALKSQDRRVRKSAVEMLGELGKKAAPALGSIRSMLKDPDIDVAEAARMAVIKLGGKVALPAAGSPAKVERLARLTASSDWGVSQRAWADLGKLTNREAAVEPLMKVFRSAGGSAVGTNLPKFLSDLGTEACRAPLLEILDSARLSSDAWQQEHLVGSACRALLELQGGVPALRSALASELLRFILMRGLMSADERERPAIVETLTEDERRSVVAEATSFFRSVDDKDEWAYGVSGALGALGGGAIEPLLEVFRSVTPSTIQPDGSVREEDEGRDGPPASALVRMPGGIERLGPLCSAGEYERVLVRAHNYGDMRNPELNKALGEIATPKAVGRLLTVLLARHWDAETRGPAREALVKAGKAAHQQLIRELEVMWPANREAQTAYKREVLSVLGETGDKVCIPILKAFLAYDPPSAEDAEAAIHAIRTRCGVKDSADLNVPPSLTTKKVGMTGDAYVDDCFRIDFDEMYEGRVWHQIPEARAIPEARNAGRLDEALRLAEELRQDQPDFYFSYYWLAELHRRQGRDEEARKALIEGLGCARSKQSLCQAMGELEWERRNLPEAVKWWIKSVAVQVGSQYATDYVAFLHLSYVAEALGLRTACSELRSWVDRLRSGQIRLTAEAENEFYLATIEQGAPPLQRAIERLEDHYLRSSEE
jgi:HEAT repeat protein